MSLILRKNPKRNRTQPKRFEDEKFVCGSIDRYQHAYDGWYKEGTTVANIEDAENYYKRQYRWRSFPESLLEFASIWRDMKMVLPSDILSHIGSFLNFSKKDQTFLIADDEFVVADESEDDVEIQESDEEVWNSGEDETDAESEWSEYSEEVYKQDSDYD